MDINTFQLKKGDIFFVKKKNWLGTLIYWFQNIVSKDKDNPYTHVGIVVDEKGTMFEVSGFFTKIGGNIREKYNESDLCIMRYDDLKLYQYHQGLDSIKNLEGMWYPYYRLFLHMLGIEKFHADQRKECSVMVATYMAHAGIKLKKPSVWEYSVDDLYDELKHNKWIKLYK